jgi:hypothetical protein
MPGFGQKLLTGAQVESLARCQHMVMQITRPGDPNLAPADPQPTAASRLQSDHPGEMQATGNVVQHLQCAG